MPMPIAGPWREENGLPRELTLTHMDPARDYQPGTVRSTRQDSSGLAKAAYDIAVVLDAAEAKARAEQAHRDLWAARRQDRDGQHEYVGTPVRLFSSAPRRAQPC
jgi:hypothetical protein